MNSLQIIAIIVYWSIDFELFHKVSTSCLTICRPVVLKMCRLIVLSTSCLAPPPSLKSKKCVIKVAIENAKLKLLKVVYSYNNAVCGSSKPFFLQLTLETWGLWIFSSKCDVILRFRQISFNMPQDFMRMPR